MMSLPKKIDWELMESILEVKSVFSLHFYSIKR